MLLLLLVIFSAVFIVVFIVKILLDTLCIEAYVHSMEMNTKKNYQISLDEKAMDKMDELLKLAGIRRSSFFNTLLVETVKAINLGSVPDISKMTLPQVFSVMGSLGEMLQGK
jgi:hypothetical protein